MESILIEKYDIKLSSLMTCDKNIANFDFSKKLDTKETLVYLNEAY